MFKSSQAISTLSGKSHLFARDPTLGKKKKNKWTKGREERDYTQKWWV